MVCRNSAKLNQQRAHHVPQRRTHQNVDDRRHGIDNVVDNAAADSLNGPFLFHEILVQNLIHRLFPGQAALGTGIFIHLVHVLSDDDLELVACPLSSQNPGEFFDFRDLHQRTILHIQAKPGRAVGQERDICCAANLLKNGGCQIGIVFFCHNDHSQIIFIYCLHQARF